MWEKVGGIYFQQMRLWLALSQRYASTRRLLTALTQHVRAVMTLWRSYLVWVRSDPKNGLLLIGSSVPFNENLHDFELMRAAEGWH